MSATPSLEVNSRTTSILLNAGHTLDHMFLLVFATAVTSIAQEFGVARWEDLMPYGVGAFFFFGIGSLPAGQLGDRWGRRAMMLVYFFGMAASAVAICFTQTPLQIGMALAVMGIFSSIYHPVGIPMLLRHAKRPGLAIGINGLCGNLGLAASAVVTGLMVKHFGWRMAFCLPALISVICGAWFAWATPPQAAPAKTPRPKSDATSTHVGSFKRLMWVITLTSTSAGVLFNLSTNGNYELLAHRLQAITQDPAQLGALLAVVYTIAALTQPVIGHLIDRFDLKTLYLSVISTQIVLIGLSVYAQGWAFFALQLAFMASIFAAVPFIDAVIVRTVDDSIRSRVYGLRLTFSLGGSSLAVWLLGPIVKQNGFDFLLLLMTVNAICTWILAWQLPQVSPAPSAKPAGAV